MAKNRPSYLIPSSTQATELRDLVARGNGFFHIGADAIPSLIPEPLREQWDSAVVIVSGSTGSSGSLTVIGHRIDRKAGMLDHDPFSISVAACEPQRVGVLIHHAAFPGRSVPLSTGLTSSSTGGFFATHPPFGLTSGSTGQLPEPLSHAIDVAQRALSSTSVT